MTVRLDPVDRDIAVVLDPFRVCLEKALAVTRTHHFADVLRDIATTRARLFLAVEDDRPKAAIVCNIKVFPLVDILNVWLAAGELVDLAGFTDAIRAEARAVDCERVWASGRAGWWRLLPRHGWRSLGSCLEVMA